MAKYDEQLKRMGYLMEFRSPSTEDKPSPIEYHTQGADGKVYGIIREGAKYYIKTTTPGKENIRESYSYIGGFSEKRHNEFNSYDAATKHLEMKMMSLNEAYGVNNNVEVADINHTEKAFAVLTEEARKELNRIKAIFENSENIGNHGDPESKGTAKPQETEKNNEPFEEKTEAELDKDPKFEATVKSANSDFEEVKNVDAQLTSDKLQKGGEELKNYDYAHDDLDGEGVADKQPKGGKAVMVNESEGNDEEEIGEDELEGMLKEMEDLIAGDCEALEGPSPKGDDGEGETMDRIEESECSDGKSCAIEGDEETLKNFQAKGDLPVQTVDRIDEAVERIYNMVRESLKAKKMVKEDLGVWGKHPRYRKEPMTLPDNHEVAPDPKHRDFDDDCVKGDTSYGKGPGKGAPFEEIVNILTDGIVKRLMRENFEKKKF